MKVIAVINQKGGVGKTTTVVNLGAALAARGHKVCLIDLDSQSQLTLHLGVEVGPDDKTIYDVLTRGADLPSATINVSENLDVVPSVVDLAAAEMELVGTVGRELVLADRFAADALPHEFVLIDCPPSLGLLTLNALAAADELLIPLQAHFFGLQGLGRLFETVSLVRQRINPRLRVGGVMFCMYERQTRLAGEVVADLSAFLASARGTDAPWAEARIFQNAIRRNVKLAECPSYGRTIFDYEPNSNGAADYSVLADEFLACFAPQTHAPAQGEPPAAPDETEPDAPGEAVDVDEPVEPEVTVPEVTSHEPTEPELTEPSEPAPAEPPPTPDETGPDAPGEPVDVDEPVEPGVTAPEVIAPEVVLPESTAPAPAQVAASPVEPVGEAATVAAPVRPDPPGEGEPARCEPVQTYTPVVPEPVDESPPAPIHRDVRVSQAPAVNERASVIPVPPPWPGPATPPPGASPQA